MFGLLYFNIWPHLWFEIISSSRYSTICMPITHLTQIFWYLSSSGNASLSYSLSVMGMQHFHTMKHIAPPNFVWPLPPSSLTIVSVDTSHFSDSISFERQCKLLLLGITSLLHCLSIVWMVHRQQWWTGGFMAGSLHVPANCVNIFLSWDSLWQDNILPS
jgi:hypothetical protein